MNLSIDFCSLWFLKKKKGLFHLLKALVFILDNGIEFVVEFLTSIVLYISVFIIFFKIGLILLR